MRLLRKICQFVAMLLLLAACGGGAPASTQPTPLAGVAETDQPTNGAPAGSGATAAPTTEAPADTAEPTSPAAATIEPTMTGEATPPVGQTAPATETPAAGQASAFELQTDSVWILTGDRVIGLSEGNPQMPVQAQGGVRAAPDGSRVVYNEGEPGSQQSRLVVKSTITGDVEQLANLEGGAINPVFSPDGGSLAYTSVNGMTGWQLIVVDLRSNEGRVLQSGAFAEGQSWLVSVPQQWTDAGLVVSQAAWFGEINSSGLSRVDPASGAVTPLYQKAGLSATLSPDETKVAAVAGSLPMGGPGNLTLTIVDLASGQEVVAAEGLPGLWTPEWSPDGERLAYVDTSFESAESTLRLFNVDGSPAGVLQFGPGSRAGVLRDVAWRDNQTLVLVVVDGMSVRVYEVGAAELEQGEPREVAVFDAETSPGTPHEVVYVPR
ncbi:MAG TPA: hypothetical protein VEZ12_00490 [Herpetosiphonaceae bacterium]|nr:hypothetical protein [Herpetosiphonaceae bacterium]